jgi:hypothetical protein
MGYICVFQLGEMEKWLTEEFKQKTTKRSGTQIDDIKKQNDGYGLRVANTLQDLHALNV